MTSPTEKIIYDWSSGKTLMIVFLIILTCCSLWVILNSSLLLLLYIIPMFIILSWTYSRIIITEKAIYKYHYFRFYNRKNIIPLSHIKKFENGRAKETNYSYRITYFKKKINGRFSLKDEVNFQFLIKDQDDFNKVLDFFKSKNIKINAEYPWYNDRIYNDPK